MEKLYKRSRLMYIFEAGLEYLISILVADMYLASLSLELGLDEGVTGVLSSIISLGCLFQLVAMLLNKGRSKWIVLGLSVLNQLLFMSLYFIPLTGWQGGTKRIVFIVVIILAYFFYNVAHPKKINWLMSLVDDEKRGRFTAKKEVISLISGVVFNFVMGAVVEHYKNMGQIRTAFIICGFTILGIMVLHTITMLLTVERKREGTTIEAKKSRIIDTFKDKNVLKITLVLCLWQIASNSAVPFYGAYKVDALGFSTTFGVAILGAIYALARSIFSFVWGKYADKYSFAKMLRICFAIAGCAFLVNTFYRPENGHVVYTIYYVLYAIALGGINSALINLCYDYVSPEKRTNALAVSLAISGVCGFLTALAMSPLVNYIKNSGNMLFGMSIYAQQLLSLIACVMTIITMLLVSFMFCKRDNRSRAEKLIEQKTEE